ncbi:MAG: dihydroorotase [Bifidobacterium sp.]|jgi:dihydroorotase|nr:dihydroorotase [Bifidobacterium sp.]
MPQIAQSMRTITFDNVRVWDTGEIISVIVPGTDDARLLDEAGPFPDGDVVVDGTGYTIAPGFADPHVHFRDPGQTYKESMLSGCQAAASGGYTHVLVMPNTLPAMDGERVTDDQVRRGDPGAAEVIGAGSDNVIDYLQRYESIHDVSLPCRYDLCVCASRGRAGRRASDPDRWIPYMGDAHAEGRLRHPITAISDDGAAVTEPTLQAVLDNARRTGLYLIEHCEHHETGCMNEGETSRRLKVPGIPPETELAVVARDIAAARRTGVHIHFQHVSTAASFDAIRKAKSEGLPITCETAPHYMALCDEDILEYGPMAKMNPPLRSSADRRATIEAVADGTVDLLATDHAPHTMSEKTTDLLHAPNGIIGLECAYGVCHRILVDGGHISERRLIELMSLAPARLMGYQCANIASMISPRGGRDGAGVMDLRGIPRSDATDFTLLSTGEEWTVRPELFHSHARNTPFGGWKVTGRTLATILGSRLVFSRIPSTRIKERHN